MTESQRRIDRAIAGYKSALMSNTKWRKLLQLVGEKNIRIQFSFVRDENFLSEITFPKGGVENDRTTDCTGHGPFYFRDIFAVKILRFENKQDRSTGKKYLDETKFDDFVASLEKLGQYPIVIKDDCAIIYGYEK